jgi:uncharacterized protein YjbJ (UPF0337 family)
MNKDQVKGTVKELSGKLQKKGGEIVGSPAQQAKGLIKEVEGQAQKHLGDLKDVVKRNQAKTYP